jgi:hypothetical protein
VRLLTRSNRRAGCMTRGPGPPCWARWSQRAAPTWHGCMPPAWLSALSPAGLGESEGVLVTTGWLHAPRARGGFFCSRLACMTCGTQPPRRGGGGENLGACWRRLGPRRLGAQVGRVAFKRGATPLEGNHVFALPSCIVSSHLPSPRAGGARNPSVLSSEERNFVEVGTFQPSFGFKDFHQAARLHPLAGGHPTR